MSSLISSIYTQPRRTRRGTRADGTNPRATGTNPNALKAKVAVLERRIEQLTAAPAYRPGMGKEFYRTKEWRRVRWHVLSCSNGQCAMCGATARSTGQPMHVDHIKPRSKFPHLELVRSNLQVLCADCNVGKGSAIWHSPLAAVK